MTNMQHAEIVEELRKIYSELARIRAITLIKPPVPKRVKYKMPPEILRILIEVEREHKVPISDILGHGRVAHVSKARSEAMYRARVETNYSYPEIGRAFKRHHTTVIAAVERRTNG